MPSYRALLLLSLAACAAHDGPGQPDPPTPAARVEVKIASVQLVQNCNDPPTDATLEAASDQERAHSKPSHTGDVQAGAALANAPGGWTPPCTQSTMQLSLANAGDREARVRIEAVRLLDAASKREASKVEARKPSQWNPSGAYQPWDEVVPQGGTVKVGYRLGEPDWSQVDTILGPGDPYARPYVLEVDVSVDGITQTVRSPEFVREPVHVIVT